MNPSKHQIRHVVEAFYKTPWAIVPAKLEQIAAVVEARTNGELLDQATIQARIGSNRRRDDVDTPYQNVNGAAVVPLVGVLGPKMNLMMDISGGTSTQQFSAAVEQAVADPDVKAIILDIDSPGGSVLGAAEAAAVVRAAGEKKPTVAVATGQMCSAAYYIGSAAKEVVASPSSQIGSIGVYAVHTNQRPADLKAGLEKTVISAGSHKADGTAYEPLSKQGKATLQEQVDAYYGQFVASVASYRSVTPQTVEAEFGGGKLFIASESLEHGMIDRIGTLQEIVSELGTTSPPAVAPNSTLLRKATAMTTPTTPQGSLAPDNQDPIATATLAERSRIEDMQAIAETFSPDVDAAFVQQHIDAGTDLDKFRAEVIPHVGQKRNTPGHGRPVGLLPAGSQADNFHSQAVDALSERVGLETSNRGRQNDLRGMSLVRLAEECLAQRNGRRAVGSTSDIVRAALSSSGELVSVGGVFAGGQPYQTPGDFPYIMSALANKAAEAPPPFNPSTFQEWAWQRPSVPDRKPATLVRSGAFAEFPEHVDGDDYEQSSLGEDRSWLQVAEYGDEFGFTPMMMEHDDLGVLMTALSDKRMAHDQTLNRLCVNLLVANPACVDGVALFHAGSHGNDIAAGAAPSTAQLAAMLTLLRAQTDVGGRRTLAYPLDLILIPQALEVGCMQLLRATLQIYPTLDTGTDPFRGVVDYHVEPMLTANSVARWYGFAPPSVGRAIAYCYQIGYERMRTTNYYNPQNNCRIFQFAGRFAAGVNNYRGVIRNEGTGA